MSELFREKQLTIDNFGEKTVDYRYFSGKIHLHSKVDHREFSRKTQLNIGNFLGKTLNFGNFQEKPVDYREFLEKKQLNIGNFLEKNS